MLTMVTAQNDQSGTLLLPLMDSSGGYAVRDIQGLDPVKATLSSSSFSQMDGSQFQHARREPRNITMKLGLEPDYASQSVAGLRSALYDYFMPKSSLVFGLYIDDAPFATTAAVVESCDNNMFSADPEVDISMMCYDPDFYAPAPAVIGGLTSSGLTTQNIPYDGTSETGVIVTIPSLAAGAAGFTLYNTTSDNVIQKFDINGTFLLNDVLTINSVLGMKAVTVVRAGLPVSVMYFVDQNSTWITLNRGDNAFRIYSAGAAKAFTLEYTTKYGGL